MTFHSGKDGKTTVNGNEVPITDWSVDPMATLVDFKNSKTGLFPKREATFRDATVSLGIDFDFDANPFAAPISITPGTTLTNTKLYLNGLAGLFHNFASLVVEGTPQQLSVEGKIITRVNCRVDGTFSLAGGVTP